MYSVNFGIFNIHRIPPNCYFWILVLKWQLVEAKKLNIIILEIHSIYNRNIDLGKNTWMSLQIPRRRPLTQPLNQLMNIMMKIITMIYTNHMKMIMIPVTVQIQNLAHTVLILIGAQQKLTIAMMKILTPGWVTDFLIAKMVQYLITVISETL